MMTETTNARDEAIQTIKAALKARSGKTWSVTGGRGTAWGWIRIHVPPARRTEFGYMSEADRAELAELLTLTHVHQQGVQVASSHAHYDEFVMRAKGAVPVADAIAQPYWD